MLAGMESSSISASRREVNYQPTPTAEKFHQDSSFIRCLIGPFGSGKSVACCMEILSRAFEQPLHNGKRRSRWAVIRNTQSQLKDTTIKTWQDWIPPEVGKWHEADMTFTLSRDDVELEVLFRALDKPKDVQRLLSMELTGAWLNEAREIPRAVFDAVQGRIGRYPKEQEAKGWCGLIIDTNPPDMDHYIYKLFEEERPPEFRIFHQPSGMSDEAENTTNLPPRYYERMSRGKTDDWIRVYVHGEYGFVQDGKPIWPEYSDTIHCQEFEPIQGAKYWFGCDWGLTPAGVIAQRDVEGRWFILDEIVADNMGAKRFASETVRMMGEHYPHAEWERMAGDPAGEQRSQTNEQTVFQVARAEGLMVTPGPTNDWILRRESVAAPLSRLIDGRPGLVIHPRCKTLRKGLGGGYCYRRLHTAADKWSDKPDKNEYSHVCDALTYLLTAGGEGIKAIAPKGHEYQQPVKINHSWHVF